MRGRGRRRPADGLEPADLGGATRGRPHRRCRRAGAAQHLGDAVVAGEGPDRGLVVRDEAQGEHRLQDPLAQTAVVGHAVVARARGELGVRLVGPPADLDAVLVLLPRAPRQVQDLEREFLGHGRAVRDARAVVALHDRDPGVADVHGVRRRRRARPGVAELVRRRSSRQCSRSMPAPDRASRPVRLTTGTKNAPTTGSSRSKTWRTVSERSTGRMNSSASALTTQSAPCTAAASRAIPVTTVPCCLRCTGSWRRSTVTSVRSAKAREQLGGAVHRAVVGDHEDVERPAPRGGRARQGGRPLRRGPSG